MASDLADLRAALNKNAEAVAEYFLGAPKSRGKRELRWGNKGSVRLLLSGRSRGSFYSFEAGRGGSLLDLISLADNCSFVEACNRARRWLGEDPPARQARPRPARNIDDLEIDRTAQAKNIWAAGLAVHGTNAAKYLDGRGLGSDLPHDLVRYVSAEAVKASGWSWWRWGAVVFSVTNFAGEIRAVQLVALDADGRAAKHWDHGGKLKISRGSLRGNAVRFPGTSDALILAEGPETAMSCWQATGFETWATLGSLANADLSSIAIGRTVILACDDDPHGPARKARLDAEKRWRAEGRNILRAMPWKISRRDKSDFNDTLKADGVEVVRERLLKPLGRTSAAATGDVLSARVAMTKIIHEQFAELLAWKGDGPAPFRALQVSPGVGKTAVVISESVRAVKAGRKINYLMPTHRLGDELVRRTNEEAVRQDVQMTARVRRGREAMNPENHNQAMCLDLEMVRAAQKVRADVRETVCENCEFKTGCAYLAQDEQEAGIWFAAQETMLNAVPSSMKGAALVVIDESFSTKGLWGDGGNKILVGFDVLDETPNTTSEAQNSDVWLELGPLRKRLKAALDGQPDGGLQRQRLIEAGLTASDAAQARGLERKSLVRVQLRPGMTRAAKLDAFRKASGNRQINRLAMLWSAVEKLIAGEATKSGLAKIERQEIEAVSFRAVRLFGATGIGKGWESKPTLNVDAILSEVILKARVPRAEVVAKISARQSVRVEQFPDKAFGKSGFHDAAVVRDVWHWVLGHARRQGGNWLAVVPKIAEEEIRRSETVPDFLRLAHFGALAGRDDFRDVDGIFVIGRPQPAPGDVERIAGILSGAEVEPLEGYYPSSPLTLHAKSGKAVTVDGDRHPDPLAEAVRKSICEGELIQAIGRGRAVNRHAEAPLEVVVLGNVAIPGLDLDEIGAWAKPTAEEAAFAESGVCLSSAGDVTLAFKINRETLKSARLRLGTFPYKALSLGNAPNLERVRFQRRGRGCKEAAAYYDRRTVPDIGAWLHERLGPVELIDDGAEVELAKVVEPLADYRGGKLPPEGRIYVQDRLSSAGISHDALARQVGISRPQLTNVLHGTFGLSAAAAERLCAVMETLPERQGRWLM